jgi:hypothetical protein
VRPVSEARFLWDETNLYIGLFAADEDIRATVTAHDGPVWTDDAFTMKIQPLPAGSVTYLVDISAAGVVTDVRRDAAGHEDPAWESGAEVAVDRDGTLNDPADFDEEWVVEAAIPLQAIGLQARAGAGALVEIRRCDTPREGTGRICGRFGGRGSELRAIELTQ